MVLHVEAELMGGQRSVGRLVQADDFNLHSLQLWWVEKHVISVGELLKQKGMPLSMGDLVENQFQEPHTNRCDNLFIKFPQI